MPMSLQVINKVNNNEAVLNILFFGNLIEGKGVYTLIDACCILKNRNIDFQCTFVGGEADITKDDFNKKVKQCGLSEQIKYLGKKYGQDKINVFENADIFAFPTYYDCFPLVLLEAMEFSLPIVTTYEGGVPDIVEDGIDGFLIKQMDVKALADKLEILIKNPELRKKMGDAGRKKYEEQFTLEKFENRLVEILEDVLKKQ